MRSAHRARSTGSRHLRRSRPRSSTSPLTRPNGPAVPSWTSMEPPTCAPSLLARVALRLPLDLATRVVFNSNRKVSYLIRRPTGRPGDRRNPRGSAHETTRREPGRRHADRDRVTNTAGINRRNEAVAQTEAWAAAHGRNIQFSYTLPTFPTGLPAAELGVLQNAVADGAKISTVNLLTFDYFIGTEQNMLTDTESAASALVGQLQTLYPGEPSRHLWHMVGVTEMPGIDDFGPDETFTKAQALAVLLWADRMGIGTLSFWALQRDNGGCPGTKGAGTCSGITQPTWFFSHVFEFFTR